MKRNKSEKTHNRQKPKKEKVINKIERMLELPPMLTGETPHIEMSGNRELIIEGSKGIVEYDENIVKISLGSNAITVIGQNLELKNITDDSCIVTGIIENVGFGV